MMHLVAIDDGLVAGKYTLGDVLFLLGAIAAFLGFTAAFMGLTNPPNPNVAKWSFALLAVAVCFVSLGLLVV